MYRGDVAEIRNELKYIASYFDDNVTEEEREALRQSNVFGRGRLGKPRFFLYDIKNTINEARDIIGYSIHCEYHTKECLDIAEYLLKLENIELIDTLRQANPQEFNFADYEKYTLKNDTFIYKTMIKNLSEYYAHKDEETLDRIYNIKKTAFSGYMKEAEESLSRILNNDKDYSTKRKLIADLQWSIGEDLGKSLKKYIEEADKRGEVEQFLNLNKDIAYAAFKEDSESFDKNCFNSKELNKLFSSIKKNYKVELFNDKIKRAVAFVVDNSAIFLLASVVAVLLCGPLHHLSIFVSKSKGMENDYLQIEENIQNYAGFSKFTHSAILPSKADGKYYAEIFGIGLDEVGGKPEFCSVTYEIDKDLYDTIFRYFDIEYQYGKDGQLVGAKNIMRENLEACGGAKSIRARWDTIEKLAEEVTKHKPVSTTLQKANDIAFDAEIEK